mgnify:CR=1 FL=1
MHTISTSSSKSACRKYKRPIRPNPLIAILVFPICFGTIVPNDNLSLFTQLFQWVLMSFFKFSVARSLWVTLGTVGAAGLSTTTVMASGNELPAPSLPWSHKGYFSQLDAARCVKLWGDPDTLPQ